ncbi:hypothetical protein D3C75_889270 [compost metagenome]
MRLVAQEQTATYANAPAWFWPLADCDAARLWAFAEMGAEPYKTGGHSAAGNHCAERLALYCHSKNLLPGTRHRAVNGQYPGRPKHFIPGDARQTSGLYEDHS